MAEASSANPAPSQHSFWRCLLLSHGKHALGRNPKQELDQHFTLLSVFATLGVREASIRMSSMTCDKCLVLA